MIKPSILRSATFRRIAAEKGSGRSWLRGRVLWTSSKISIDTLKNIEHAKRVRDAIRIGAQHHRPRRQWCAAIMQSIRLSFGHKSGFAIAGTEVTLGPALAATDSRFFGHSRSRWLTVLSVPERSFERPNLPAHRVSFKPTDHRVERPIKKARSAQIRYINPVIYSITRAAKVIRLSLRKVAAYVATVPRFFRFVYRTFRSP